jgi:ketosteroid isomerase-like protein
VKNAALLLLLISSFSFAKSPRDVAIQQVAQAERDFAKMSVAEGVRASFLANFADDAISFTPQPTKPADLFGPPPADPKAPRKNTLDWYPVWTDASRSGDFAFSTGPSVTTDNATGRKVRFGNFSSVWRKQSDGKWKVVLDIGTEHAEPPAFAKKPWSAAEPSKYKGRPASPDTEADALKLFDKQFANGKKLTDAYAQVLTKESRLHRTGLFPQLGRDAILDHLSKAGDETVSFEPMGAAVASSADLGYTYGAYTTQPGDKKGYYAHFWKREKNGDWNLVIDVTNPQPSTD